MYRWFLTAKEAGAGVGAVVLGVPSIDTPPAPLEAFMPANGGTVAGAMVGDEEAAGEAAATGAVALLLLGGAVGVVALGGWALKAVARDKVSGTP